MRIVGSFAVRASTSLTIKFSSGFSQTLHLINFGFINQNKQTALLSLTPVSKYRLAIFRFCPQPLTTLTHHKYECLNNNLGSIFMNDSNWSLAA
jgi:hypothetical protein